MGPNHSAAIAANLAPGRGRVSQGLAQVLNAIALPICLKDQHHRWQFLNQAYADLLGYPPAELLGQEAAAIFPSAVADAFQEAALVVLSQGQAHQHQVTLGHRILMATTSLIDQEDPDPLVMVTLQDITPQWQMEQTLKQQQERERLYHQVQQLNSDLERQVTERAEELQTALEVEASLKRITDRVRDSLDVNQIMLTAVQELTEALGAKGSNTALYNLEQRTSTIYYEYNSSNSAIPAYQGRVSQMDAFPEVYNQLLRGQYFQFCSMIPNPDRGYVAMLACPIVDDRGVLGDLWLINGCDYGFNDIEIRLAQQVANQCAIAIRQARLYEAAQS